MIILASTSPRRISIFKRLGLPFKAVPPNFDETNHPISDSLQIPLEFAEKKALSVYENYPNDTVIGFDTIVLFNGKVIGKPKDMNEAISFLLEMSDSVHEVLTGVFIVNYIKKLRYGFVEKSSVKFKKLNKKIILEYFSKINPLDKAGAYSIMECKDMVIDSITGSSDNVAGAPSETLLEVLKNF